MFLSLTSALRGFHRWVAPVLKQVKSKKDKLPPKPPDPRNSYVEWNYEAELYAFGKRLGEKFNSNLLKEALTATSYVQEEEKKQLAVGIESEIALSDNKELAEKGRMFMDNYVSSYLNSTLTKLPNHYKSKIKEFLLSEDMLANISQNIGIDDIILCPSYPASGSVLREGLEAVVGAVCASSGAEQGGRFVRDMVCSQLCGRDLSPLCTPDQPVLALDEALATMQLPPPEPRLISQAAVNTLLPAYHVGYYSQKSLIGKGFGESVGEAKEMAACDALWKLWDVHSRRKPFPMNIEFPPKSLG